jgi:hypothetical protein
MSRAARWRIRRWPPRSCRGRSVDQVTSPLADRARRPGPDVADALVGDADIAEDDGEDLLVHRPLLEELHGRQAQALLLDFGGAGREAARHHAADIRPVAGIGQPRKQRAAIEERLHEAHVHQVRAAEIGVVDDVDVARLQVLGAVDHGLGAELHRADEDRQSQLALRDQFARAAVVDAIERSAPRVTG